MKNSKISWTRHTFSPWIFCTRVSPGCQHCYAETMMADRFGKVEWGPQGQRVRTSADYWRQPLKWNREAAAAGERHRVFCASLADVFEIKADQKADLSNWLLDLCALIVATPHLDWLLLTKRPENAKWDWKTFPDNIWIGTSVENQEYADKRIPELLKIPAPVRFLSVEPMLGPVDLSPWLDQIQWVIVGGESGPAARPMHPDWVRSVRDQCEAAGVPFFFKQWGEWGEMLTNPKHGFLFIKESGYQVQLGTKYIVFDDLTEMARAGKKHTGHMLDGREHREFPQSRINNHTGEAAESDYEVAS